MKNFLEPIIEEFKSLISKDIPTMSEYDIMADLCNKGLSKVAVLDDFEEVVKQFKNYLKLQKINNIPPDIIDDNIEFNSKFPFYFKRYTSRFIRTDQAKHCNTFIDPIPNVCPECGELDIPSTVLVFKREEFYFHLNAEKMREQYGGNWAAFGNGDIAHVLKVSFILVKQPDGTLVREIN